MADEQTYDDWRNASIARAEQSSDTQPAQDTEQPQQASDAPAQPSAQPSEQPASE